MINQPKSDQDSAIAADFLSQLWGRMYKNLTETYGIDKKDAASIVCEYIKSNSMTTLVIDTKGRTDDIL
jgi:hypothetical protein